MQLPPLTRALLPVQSRVKESVVKQPVVKEPVEMASVVKELVVMAWVVIPESASFSRLSQSRIEFG
ncbi:hypothetical protein H257_06197 [Aphanomyces astaci]|uniref:Uncharacterized protein n=1 Tax=Aphanomyces astaci TaxID=112090 RepID=W4GNW3_APHAT|nr:hypothetical protein H257_06197 [Aphanomyces astaci]ETV80694.1 hypothetical protein H257_06197 [Aphanomyces astaci]|eukprot:XP_009829641.1 hypothetical protein H257_06197 [Aphanomyces astaci]